MSYTDLTDEEWAKIQNLFIKLNIQTNSKVSLRSIMNGIRYKLYHKCKWSAVHCKYGKGQTITGYWYKWKNQGLWDDLLWEFSETPRTYSQVYSQEE